MTIVEQVLNKLNVEYIKTASSWKTTYKTSTSIVVEKINLKNKSTTCQKQQLLVESVHINGLYTPSTAVEDVLEFIHS